MPLYRLSILLSWPGNSLASPAKRLEAESWLRKAARTGLPEAMSKLDALATERGWRRRIWPFNRRLG
ncbi:hypothetical protein [Nocardia sp. CA-120079]|uniref:hypothetical protein n=1 Tax=Nocardia sp. CA-120079 TaxID=3239974 RepID=UPI003D975B5A